MTPEQIAELKQLESKATAGKWRSDGYRVYATLPKPMNPHGVESVLFDGKCYDSNDADMDLCAALRNHAKELIVAAEQNARLVKALEKIEKAETTFSDNVTMTAAQLRQIARAVLAEVRNGQ